MKAFLVTSLFTVTIVSIFFPLGASGASTQNGAAKLIVKRAANYGQNIDLVVFVDGQQKARLSWGQMYEAPLAAGPHDVILSVSSDLRSLPVRNHILVAPGETYRLYGGFHGKRLVSSLATSS